MQLRRWRSLKALSAAAALATTIAVTPASAQNTLATQDSASKQPTLPKPMPNLTIPGSGIAETKPPKPHATRTHARHHSARRDGSSDIERPALANVELLAPLVYPPQPPHVTVPMPAYPPETFITRFTTPAPPVVCRPAPYDPNLPDLHLVRERPVVCAADNP